MWNSPVEQGQWRRRLFNPRADSAAACGEVCRESGCSTEAHEGTWWSRDPPAAHGGPYPGAQRRLWDMGNLHCCRLLAGPKDMEKEADIRAGLLARLVTLQETHTGAVFPEGLHPLKGIHTGPVWEVHCIRRMLEKFVEDCLLCWSRKNVRSLMSLRREEWQTRSEEVTTTPHHPSLQRGR